MSDDVAAPSVQRWNFARNDVWPPAQNASRDRLSDPGHNSWRSLRDEGQGTRDEFDIVLLCHHHDGLLTESLFEKELFSFPATYSAS